MKVDYNFNFGIDPYGSEHFKYYDAWFRLLDELKSRYPGVFFEGCASGGMRLDLNILRHFDGHFLSDNVNPHNVLSMYQGALLRLPPGRITKWVVLRTIEQTIPMYGFDPESTPKRLITPAVTGIPWNNFVTTNMDFAARVALPGMFGLSGDISGLPDNDKERLRQHISFYKKWREFIVKSIAYLLTPPISKGDYSGWAAIQLQNPEDTGSLLFVYRLDNACSEKWFCLQGLEAERMYSVTDEDTPDLTPLTYSGRQLIQEGIHISITNKNDAKIIVVTPVGDKT